MDNTWTARREDLLTKALQRMDERTDSNGVEPCRSLAAKKRRVFGDGESHIDCESSRNQRGVAEECGIRKSCRKMMEIMPPLDGIGEAGKALTCVPGELMKTMPLKVGPPRLVQEDQECGTKET
jgi:hypothetical protein